MWPYEVDSFRYQDENEITRSYFPDFKVWLSKKDFYYLEVKGYKTERDSLKWNSLRKQGYSLEIWFKKDIKKEEDSLSAELP